MQQPPWHEHIAKNTDEVIAKIKQQKDCLLNNPILPMPDFSEIEKFALYHYWSYSESVNVFQVVGTAHPDYNTGITWIDMLRVGKRMQLNLGLLLSNPDYYFSTERKIPDMQYTKIDNDIYISGEGNHRTAIAKVLFFLTGNSILHGINYNEFRFDHEMFNLFEELKILIAERRLPMEVTPVKKTVKRDDTPGWMKEYYENFLKIKDYKTQTEILLNKEQAKEYLDKLKKKSKKFPFWSLFKAI